MVSFILHDINSAGALKELQVTKGKPNLNWKIFESHKTNKESSIKLLLLFKHRKRAKHQLMIKPARYNGLRRERKTYQVRSLGGSRRFCPELEGRFQPLASTGDKQLRGRPATGD